MKIDLSCPVEMQSFEFLRDDAGNLRVYMRLFNCAQSALTCLEGAVRWINAENDSYTETQFALDMANVGPRSEFELQSSTAGAPERTRMLVYFTRADFADGTKWAGSAESLKSYPGAPILPGAMANSLRAAAGEDAICCAFAHESGDWQCVCGRWNEKDNEKCMRCERERDFVLAHFHPEAVEQLGPAPEPEGIEAAVGQIDLEELGALYAQNQDHFAAQEIDDEPEEPIETAPKRPLSPLTRILICIVLAVVFAYAALTVRSYRYANSQSAGLMPLSYASDTASF